MSVSIVLYDDHSMERVRKNIYDYFLKIDKVDVTKDILYFNNIYIKFQKRLITINSLEDSWRIQECLNVVLKDEQVTVNYGNRMEYSKSYTKTLPLTINYS